MDYEKIIKAGKISSEVKDYAKSFVVKGMPLLDIAEKIENKIIGLGGEIAFPTNLSIDNIAAHYTPSHNDETLASGILKIDLGVHVDGWISDTAFTMDLEDSEINRKLIEASDKALLAAENTIKEGVSTDDIGKNISNAIESCGFNSIVNLSGHEVKQYDLHAGITIPNFNDKKDVIIKKGIYAIEPFATNGNGKVKDGNPSGIYLLIDDKNVRSPIARDVLNFISEEYGTLPFCERWIVKEFGVKGLFGLKQLEQNGNLHHFAQLVEVSGGLVSQTENTVLVKDEVIVTSRN